MSMAGGCFTGKNKAMITYAPLEKQHGPAVRMFTFPNYEGHLAFHENRKVEPIGYVAFDNDQPVGLALGAIPHDGAEPALLSVYVQAQHRNQGIGRRLLAHWEEAMRAQGVTRIGVTYTAGKPGTDALEKVLAHNDWEPPQPRMLVIKSTPELCNRSPWMRRKPLPPEYEIISWCDVTEADKEEIRRSQAAEPWIPEDLVPFQHEKGYDPVTSVALRYEGKIVGWVINHMLGKEIVRFTCSFVRKDLQRRGRVFALYVEAGHRMELNGLPYCMWTVPLAHKEMAAFAQRWMAPNSVFASETRGTGKQLQPAQ